MDIWIYGYMDIWIYGYMCYRSRVWQALSVEVIWFVIGVYSFIKNLQEVIYQIHLFHINYDTGVNIVF